jgi:hypothetical protein
MDFCALTYMPQHEARLQAASDERRARDLKRYEPLPDVTRKRIHCQQT